MREIGGYLGLDTYHLPMRHEGAIALNSGRNCLAYLIEKKNIKKIYLPKFLCASVGDICKRMKVEIEYYSIGDNLLPTVKEIKNGWLYIVNYYGQIDNHIIKGYKARFDKIIVDNIQAYYQEPCESVDTIYTCRKFFGVTDGAFLYSDIREDDSIEIDQSWSRFKHIVGSYENGASSFYTTYTLAEKEFENMPVRRMSKLTYNLLHGIDYDYVRDIRTQNFSYLHDKFKEINKLKVVVPNGPYMYPLYLKQGSDIRKKLQQAKIFIPTLWPDVFDLCDGNELEYDLAKSILPIPVDQRYGIEDMEKIVSFIQKEITEVSHEIS